MAVVTISRLMGAAGDEIAVKVAKRLGYNCVDTGLIVRVAERAGVSLDVVRDFDEQTQSRAVGWLKGFITPKMSGILIGETDRIDTKTFVEYTKTIIRGLAKEGNMVIVGHASQFILADFENAYHVRIIAGEHARIERLMEELKISTTEARAMIRKNDTMRQYYVEQYFGSNLDNPLAYYLIIDSEKNGLEETAAIITDAVKAFSAAREYIPGVHDRRRTERRSRNDRRTVNRNSGIASRSLKELNDTLIHGRHLHLRSVTDRRKHDRRTGHDS
jgi:cytidylate kinase